MFTYCIHIYDTHNYMSCWLIDTTGLQSLFAVVELNCSITVTCTFATGASSTGCQVTVFMRDSLQEVLSRNVSRPNQATQVCESPHAL